MLSSLQTQNGLELIFRSQVLNIFLINFLFCNMTSTGQISSSSFIIKFSLSNFFLSYSVKCISCFMLRHWMTSWNLNVWNTKREPKKLLKWNQKHFPKFHKCSPWDLKKKTRKNVASATFKVILNENVSTNNKKKGKHWKFI